MIRSGKRCDVPYCKRKPAHRKPVKCVSRNGGRVHLCDRHNLTKRGHMEETRCLCFNSVEYFSVHDPCSCMGKPHDGLPEPKKLCSEFVYLYPPKACSRTQPPSQLKCSSCGTEIEHIEVYAKCTDCDDMYCNPLCTMRMATIFVKRDDGLFEAMCFACDPESLEG
jgi:hypothetical protein